MYFDVCARFSVSGSVNEVLFTDNCELKQRLSRVKEAYEDRMNEIVILKQENEDLYQQTQKQKLQIRHLTLQNEKVKMFM